MRVCVHACVHACVCACMLLVQFVKHSNHSPTHILRSCILRKGRMGLPVSLALRPPLSWHLSNTWPTTVISILHALCSANWAGRSWRLQLYKYKKLPHSSKAQWQGLCWPVISSILLANISIYRKQNQQSVRWAGCYFIWPVLKKMSFNTEGVCVCVCVCVHASVCMHLE